MIPPIQLVEDIEKILVDLLTENPLATSSESFVQHWIEFELVRMRRIPPYLLRIGINYHGEKVQHIVAENNVLVGWNEGGDALGTGQRAKMRLANFTIFPREADEHMMSDCKIGGGAVQSGFVRVEFKVRGWLGKTKNLDGKQLQKDIDLLGANKADLLIWALSETAHEKWRGAGPAHQAARRTGCLDFAPILRPVGYITEEPQEAQLDYKRVEIADNPVAQDLWAHQQRWTVRSRKIVASRDSLMPGADHYLTMVWKNG